MTYSITLNSERSEIEYDDIPGKDPSDALKNALHKYRAEEGDHVFLTSYMIVGVFKD